LAVKFIVLLAILLTEKCPANTKKQPPWWLYCLSQVMWYTRL